MTKRMLGVNVTEDPVFSCRKLLIIRDTARFHSPTCSSSAAAQRQRLREANEARGSETVVTCSFNEAVMN